MKKTHSSQTSGVEIASLATLTLLIFLWSYISGKDVNWDLVNYHYYGAYQLTSKALGHDFLAAGIQSYINPIGFLPFYYLSRTEIPSLIISFILTAIHSLNIIALWLLSKKLIPGTSSHTGIYRIIGVSLGVSAPVFLTTVGSTFVDPIASALSLFSLYFLILNRSRKTLFLSAILMGCAIGLKLTNLYLVPAFIITFLFLSINNGQLLISTFIAGLGAILGILAFHGYWSYQLWLEFGNPIFPFANKIFASPDFPLVSLHDARFQLGGWIDLILLPIRVMATESGIYTENISADIRLFVLLICSIAFLLFKKSPEKKFQNEHPLIANNYFSATIIFCTAAYITWLAGTTIGRYAISIFLIIGILIPALLCRITSKQKVIFFSLVTLFLQLIHGVYTVGNLKWQPTSWDGSWVNALVPEKLQKEKSMFLSVGIQTYSAIIPFMNKDSVFVNAVGQYTLPSGDNISERLKRMIEEWDGPFYVIAGVPSEIATLPPPGRIMQDFASIMSPYGLSVAAGPCMHIKLDGNSIVSWANQEPRNGDNNRYFNILACPIEPTVDAAATRKESLNPTIEAALDFVEHVCHKQASPSPTYTIRGKDGWQRVYFNTQSSVLVKNEQVILRPHRSVADIYLGTVSDIAGGKLQPRFCENSSAIK